MTVLQLAEFVSRHPELTPEVVISWSAEFGCVEVQLKFDRQTPSRQARPNPGTSTTLSLSLKTEAGVEQLHQVPGDQLHRWLERMLGEAVVYAVPSNC